MAGELPPDPAPHSVEAFQCGGCGASITLRIKGQSLAAVCSACHALVDVDDPNCQIISKQLARTRGPLIALGRRGSLFGTTYEVVGYMIRSTSDGTYTWEEYLLWNPQQGFRWLHHDQGHWTFFTMVTDKPTVARFVNQIAEHNGKTYRLFTRGSARVTYVLGEFYWRVKVGEQVETSDYIRPPDMLSQERSKGEIVWSLGQYLEQAAICETFKLERAGPRHTSVAPNQPSPYDGLVHRMGPRLIMFVLTLAIILTLSGGREVELVHRDFFYRSDQASKVLISEGFDVDGSSGNLVVDYRMRDTFTNTWVDFTTTLVNEASGEIAQSATEVAYYPGVDLNDWTEGSRAGRVVMPNVGAGRYHLEIEVEMDPTRGVFRDESLYFTTIVRRGVTIWSNAVAALVALLLFPAVLYWRAHTFESNRWSQSDYSHDQHEV